MRRISRLKHRITLLEQQPELDSLGRQKRGNAYWQPVAVVWAEVRQINGQEIERAKQMLATCSHMIAIRYREGVTTSMRVKFGDRQFEIRAVLDADSGGRELQLVCGEAI
ncbi:MAG: phage head closure protein [Pirellulales bacterium]